MGHGGRTNTQTRPKPVEQKPTEQQPSSAPAPSSQPGEPEYIGEVFNAIANINNLEIKQDWHGHDYYSIKDVRDVVNPNYISGGDAYSTNCAICTVAAEERARGVNVEAAARAKTWRGVPNIYEIDYSDANNVVVSEGGGILGAPSMSHIESFAAFRNTNQFSSDLTTSVSKLMTTMTNWGTGARAELGVFWKTGGGHSVGVYNYKGTIAIVDTQTGRMYAGERQITNYLSSTHTEYSSLIRLDNAKHKENIKNDYNKMLLKKV